MTRPILTTALLTALLALAAPTLAAPKASKPTTAETQAQRQPENERSEFRRSQNDSPMQLAQHIQTEDLIGVWGQGVTIDEGSMLNMTIMSQDGTGTDLMILTTNNPKSSLKIRQQFTWQFNKKNTNLQPTHHRFFHHPRQRAHPTRQIPNRQNQHRQSAYAAVGWQTRYAGIHRPSQRRKTKLLQARPQQTA